MKAAVVPSVNSQWEMKSWETPNAGATQPPALKRLLLPNLKTKKK
jgi:hypothetical protein